MSFILTAIWLQLLHNYFYSDKLNFAESLLTRPLPFQIVAVATLPDHAHFEEGAHL